MIKIRPKILIKHLKLKLEAGNYFNERAQRIDLLKE